MTQNVAPILTLRSNDKTGLFDAYGAAQNRKERYPDELVMFCVDCSKSMNDSSDFTELKDTAANGSDGNSDDCPSAEESKAEEALVSPIVAGELDASSALTFTQLKGSQLCLVTVTALNC